MTDSVSVLHKISKITVFVKALKFAKKVYLIYLVIFC